MMTTNRSQARSFFSDFASVSASPSSSTYPVIVPNTVQVPYRPSIKDGVVIAFVMCLWLYSIMLMYRAWNRILNFSGVQFRSNSSSEKASVLWRWLMDRILASSLHKEGAALNPGVSSLSMNNNQDLERSVNDQSPKETTDIALVELTCLPVDTAPDPLNGLPLPKRGGLDKCLSQDHEMGRPPWSIHLHRRSDTSSETDLCHVNKNASFKTTKGVTQTRPIPIVRSGQSPTDQLRSIRANDEDDILTLEEDEFFVSSKLDLKASTSSLVPPR
ncbi:hypothetical protein TCAL_01987 [Tigriopus californicus]|uniref:Uncharacterized protein n=2 Tax=Tigriopus californicus TaxID=6832 RepID=A0A553PPW6_TIGCA|nr:hypothetical protein TCAL_01987 [Tigriopus californicus]